MGGQAHDKTSPKKRHLTQPLHPVNPAMSYGLASAVISPKKLDQLIQAIYYRALPLLGINRCITREWRIFSERFQGIGLPNYVVNCFSAKTYYMQTMWGFEGASGELMVHVYGTAERC